MTTRSSIVCDGAELAVECACAAETLSLVVEPRTSDDPVHEAIALLAQDAPVALALTRAPGAATMVALATAVAAHGSTVPVALIGVDTDLAALRDLGRDLGLPVVSEVAPLMSMRGLPIGRGPAALDRRLPRPTRGGSDAPGRRPGGG